jgi:hypothetical protein
MQEMISLVLGVLLTLATSGSSGSVLMPAQEMLEATAVDVFSAKDWDSRQISVLGFRLGMSRTEALSVAQQRGLRLINPLPPNAGEERREDVLGIHGPDGWTGVDLVFGKDAQVEEIDMDLFVGFAGGAQWIAERLKGASRQLAVHYSDKLRVQLLGREDQHCVSHAAPPIADNSFHTYKYTRRGFVFKIDAIERGDPAKPSFHAVMVRLSFFSPQK